MTIGTSILLIAVGAILRFAVTATVSGFDIKTAGLILMIVGIVALLLAIWYTYIWSRRADNRTTVVRNTHYDR